MTMKWDWYKCSRANCTACFEDSNARMLHEDLHLVLENEEPRPRPGQGTDDPDRDRPLTFNQLFFPNASTSSTSKSRRKRGAGGVGAVASGGVTIDKLPKGQIQCYIPQINLVPIEDQPKHNIVHIKPCMIKLEKLAETDILRLVEESNKIQLRRRNERLNYSKIEDQGQESDENDYYEPNPRKTKRYYNKTKLKQEPSDQSNSKRLLAVLLDKEVECKLCEPYSKFSTMKTYYDHVIETHRSPDSTYSCPNCPYVTSPFDKASKHIMKHYTIFHELGDRICYVCKPNLDYQSKAQLIEHYQEMHCSKDDQKYHCDICNFDTFDNPLELNHHIISHSFRSDSAIIPIKHKRKFKCKICGSFKTSLNDLNNHLEYHARTSKPRKPHPFSCLICGRTFEQKRSLNSHSLTHSANNPYQCHICSSHFLCRYHLQRHLELHFGQAKKIPCLICNYEFSRKSHLERHLKKYHTVQTGISVAEYKKVRKLKNRVSRLQLPQVTPASVPPIHQIIPAKTEIIDTNLEEEFHEQLTDNFEPHEAIKSLLPKSTYTSLGTPNRYKCSICPDVSYSRLFLLQVHNKNKHQIVTDKSESDTISLTCGNCGYKSSSSEELTIHMETHIRNGKKFQCSRCPTKYNTEHKLADHIQRIHVLIPETTVYCPACKKGYGNKYRLALHRSRNCCSTTGIHLQAEESADSDVEASGKEFRCQKCPKITKSLYSLKRHEKLHLATRKFFDCQICNDKFATKGTLQRHISRVHFGIYPNTNSITTMTLSIGDGNENGEAAKNENDDDILIA